MNTVRLQIDKREIAIKPMKTWESLKKVTPLNILAER